MEEGDICAELPDFYTKQLRDRVSRCQALHSEDRPDASDLVFFISEHTQELRNCEELRANGLVESRTQRQSLLLTKSVEKPFPEASTLAHSPQHDTDETWESTLSSGVEFLAKCEFQEADHIFSKATMHCIEVYGRKHTKTAKSIHWLGVAQYRLGKYAEAEQTLESAVETREKVLGREHVDTCYSLHWLGQAQYHLGEYAEANRSYRKALSIRTRILGANHLRTTETKLALARKPRSGNGRPSRWKMPFRRSKE